jgi:hypothetical protein
MTSEKVGKRRRVGERMPSIPAGLGAGEFRFDRREMRARNVSDAIEAPSLSLVGQVVAAVENRPQRVPKMERKRFGADEHAASTKRVRAPDARENSAADPLTAFSTLPTSAAAVSLLPMAASNDPLHGVTLEQLLTELVQQFGWEELGRRVPVRCFLFDPSIKSSLTFLRRTPWARTKVEELYANWKKAGGSVNL